MRGHFFSVYSYPLEKLRLPRSHYWCGAELWTQCFGDWGLVVQQCACGRYWDSHLESFDQRMLRIAAVSIGRRSRARDYFEARLPLHYPNGEKCHQ